MYAIAHHDEASRRMRYVRDDSGSSLWSTQDRDRAKPFDSRDAAIGWATDLKSELLARILGRNAFVMDMETGDQWFIEGPEPPPRFCDDDALAFPAITADEFAALQATLKASVRPVAASQPQGRSKGPTLNLKSTGGRS